MPSTKSGRRSLIAVLSLLCAAGTASAAEDGAALPARLRRIVLHTLGSPTYDRPDRRFVFRDPLATHLLWKPSFGAHWIVWVDGTIWPRHVERGEDDFFSPPADGAYGPEWQKFLTRQATPVYSHVYMRNSRSLGIEVAHSGRSTEAFPPVQIRSVAWLLRTLLAASRGRLTESSVVGHKDVDPRPAYVSPSCARPRCGVFVDKHGRPFRWRVDPPESLFRALAAEGLDIPRPLDGDDDLRRAEAMPPDVVPADAPWLP